MEDIISADKLRHEGLAAILLKNLYSIWSQKIIDMDSNGYKRCSFYITEWLYSYLKFTEEYIRKYFEEKGYKIIEITRVPSANYKSYPRTDNLYEIEISWEE